MQKNTVRWIATVTLAGGGVLASTAAASAVTQTTPVQDSQPTCAALNNHMAGALSDLTNRVSSNSVDTVGAMNSAVDLAMLIGQAHNLGCPTLVDTANMAVANHQQPSVANILPGATNAIPGVSAAMPAANQAAPVANQAAPAVNQAAPVQHAGVPVVNQAAPVVNQAAPVQYAGVPVVNQAAPAANPATPALAAAHAVLPMLGWMSGAHTPVGEVGAPAQ